MLDLPGDADSVVDRVLGYVLRGPRGLPAALNAEWQLVPARWLAIVVVLFGLPWLQLSERQHTNALLILGFGAIFNLAVQRALHRRRGLLAFGYLTAAGDTVLSLAMVELAGGFDSPFSTVFFVVGVSIAMRSSVGPAVAMTALVIAADSLHQTSGPGALAIRSIFLTMCVLFASYLRAQAQHETMQKTAILEQMAEAVLVTDDAGRIVLTNPAAEALYAVPGHGLLGRSMQAHLLAGVRDTASETDFGTQALVRALLEEGTGAEHEVLDASGGARWISATATPLRSIHGAIQGAIVVAHDLTERKLAEERLRASEDQFRRQYKGFPLPTYSWLQAGDDFVLQDFNDAATVIDDGDIREWIGRRASERYSNQPELLAYLHHCVTEQTTLRREMSHRFRRTDSERFLVVTYVFVPPHGVMTHIEDITLTRQAEQQAEAMAQSEKLRALGQMAMGIAHDLNQSLMLVASYGELARQALAHDPPDLTELEDLMTTTTQAALDGGETVQRLLLFTRNTPDRGTQLVDLTTLVRDAAQLTAPRWRDAAQAEGRPITLHVEAQGHPSIRGSAARLRELMTNLIFNAVDALPTGGTIHVRVSGESGQGIIEVVDSGIGMSAEVRKRVFEPFFSTKGEGGTGLGLAMVFGIVEQHGGRIDVYSTPGVGTTFRIMVPLTNELAAVEPAAGAAIALAPSRPLRILAVDDEPMMTKAVVRMLKPAGHLVSVARSAEEAVEKLTEQTFDVVVSDMGMGAGMNGWELADVVKSRWPGVRFMLATGWGAALDPAEARTRGVEAVLSKPYHPSELVNALSRTELAA
jgi:PAS domain S-box-containing protein